MKDVKAPRITGARHRRDSMCYVLTTSTGENRHEGGEDGTHPEIRRI